MGAQCCTGLKSGPKPPPQRCEPVIPIESILTERQKQCLQLIFEDLSERIVDKAVNLQNFLLFFHKNGYWGVRLFKEFDYDDSKLINNEEFIRGIAIIFKSTERQKIELLYKFFTNKGEEKEGIRFQNLLTMLYNYPKEDLKIIMNDQDFFSTILKKKEVETDGPQRLESFFKIPQISNGTNGVNGGQKRVVECRLSQGNEYSSNNRQIDIQPSLFGRDIVKNIRKKDKEGTTLKVDTGTGIVEVKTMNIHQLVKKYAAKIFEDAKLKQSNGRLSFDLFQKWVMNHKKLYDNYYDGFHNEVWQQDTFSAKPKYISSKLDMKSIAKTTYKDKMIKVQVLLLHSTIIITDEKEQARPLQVISLEGMSVNRVFEVEKGFGIQITHRDGHYTPKKIYFINQEVLNQWMELLKFFKGDSIQQLYDVGKKIGTGKFSVVYECTENSTGDKFALKLIETFKLDVQAKNLIAHESSIMAIVSHPFLVSFKECIQTKTHMYILAELVDGKDLFEFVKECKYLYQEEASLIIQQLIVAVRYLHSLGIVHRDLKPQNIMIPLEKEDSQINNIKVIDFGFANYLSTLREAPPDEVLAGTPNYIAPELLKGDPFSFSIDTFAIGSIMFFILSGALPFNDYSIGEIFTKTIDGEYEFKDKRWNSVSEEAKDLINKMLANDPKQRIELDSALSHQWFTKVKEKKEKYKTNGKNERSKRKPSKLELF